MSGLTESPPLVSYRAERRVAFVVLNRPEQLNAVNDALVADLCACLVRAGEEGAGAVVLSGAGRTFCAGHDLTQTPQENLDGTTVLRLERLAEVTRLLRSLPVPVIAAVHGYALGAGCEFALCCDLVVAHPDAVFGFPEVEVGLAVTGGISHLLPLAVGAVRAKELVLLGRRLTADEAVHLGLVNAVVPDPREHAAAWATELAGKPALALALAKSCLNRGPGGDIESAFGLETAASLALMNGPSARAASDAFLDRKRGRLSNLG